MADMVGAVSTLAGLGFALFVSVEAYKQGGLFAWHPFLMTLGAVGLSTAGIQAVRSRRSVQGLGPKTQRVQFEFRALDCFVFIAGYVADFYQKILSLRVPEKLHSAMSNIALASMAGGLYTIYTNKERLGKPHWTSWHAWVGLLALGLWAVNVAIAGTNTADLEGKRLVFLWQSRNHRWLGAAAYAAGLLAVTFGVHSGWGLKSLGGEVGAWTLTATIAAIFVGVAAQGLGTPEPSRQKAV